LLFVQATTMTTVFFIGELTETVRNGQKRYMNWQGREVSYALSTPTKLI